MVFRRQVNEALGCSEWLDQNASSGTYIHCVSLNKLADFIFLQAHYRIPKWLQELYMQCRTSGEHALVRGDPEQPSLPFGAEVGPRFIPEDQRAEFRSATVNDYAIETKYNECLFNGSTPAFMLQQFQH